MRLHAIGGMCNRLQAILSLRAVHGPLDVLWTPDTPVSGADFLDVFEPLPGVTFVHHGGHADCEAWGVHPGSPASWVDGYRGLVPVEAVHERVAETVHAGLAPSFAAMHVRRTDHVPNSTSRGEWVETDNEFVEWAESTPGLPLYLATDNGETQQTMARRLPRRIFTAHSLPGVSTQELGDNRRNGTLADAVVDLFVCAGATHFKGSRWSSFSDTIERLRSLRPEPVVPGVTGDT